MTPESHQIAALIAADIDRWVPFEFVDANGRPRFAYPKAEGDVITIVMADDRWHAKRKYSATIRLVAEDPPDAAAHGDPFLRMDQSLRPVKRRMPDGWRRLRRVRAHRPKT